MGDDHSERAPRRRSRWRSRRRSRRGPVVLGLGMVLAGLGLLAWVGWQFLGTNWVAHRHQHDLTQQLERQWASGRASGPSAGRSRSASSGQPNALVRIPRFGSSYVVPVLQGVGENQLASGFGHFPGTAEVGAVGNYALAAHRVTHGEPLRRMPDLRPGDSVEIETAQETYTYRLDTDPNDLVIPFTGVWVLDPVPTNPDGTTQPAQRIGQRLITLTTCSELFHTDNRMIAFGHLVRTTPRVS